MNKTFVVVAKSLSKSSSLKVVFLVDNYLKIEHILIKKEPEAKPIETKILKEGKEGYPEKEGLPFSTRVTQTGQGSQQTLVYDVEGWFYYVKFPTSDHPEPVPIKNAKVILWDDEPWGREKIGETTTDEKGYFIFKNVDNYDGPLEGGRDLYVTVYAEDDIVAIYHGEGDDENGVYAYSTIKIEDIDEDDIEDGHLNYGKWFPPGYTSRNTVFYNYCGAFRARDYIRDAYNFLNKNVFDNIYDLDEDGHKNDPWNQPKIKIEWPDDDPVSEFFPISGNYGDEGYEEGYHIHLGNDGDAFVEDVVQHEYSHAVMWKLYNDAFPAYWDVQSPLNGHWFTLETGPGFALVEGWAEFLPNVIQHDDYYRGYHVETYNFYSNRTDKSRSWNGNSIEGAILNILYDISDDITYSDLQPFTDDDKILGEFKKLWNIIRDYNPDCLEDYSTSENDFWDAWFNEGYDYTQELSEIFHEHGIRKLQSLNIALSLNKEVYSPSESATLTVTLTDDDSKPIKDAAVSYLIKNTDDVTIKSGSCSDEGNGKYEAKFNAPETTGSYTVEVTATKSGYVDGFASTSFTVINPAEGHNIRLATLELSRNKAEPGDPVQIKCQIDNRGEYTEDVNVDIAISGPDYSFSPSTISVGSLKPSHTTGIKAIYTWNIPTNAKTGYYTIKVTAWSPSGDEDFSDNEKSTSVYVSTGEPPTYNAYYYEYRILEWNDNADYRKYGWPFKGAYGPVTFHNSYTGHDYTIAIPGVYPEG